MAVAPHRSSQWKNDGLCPGNEDHALKQLKKLLAPFSIKHFYTEGWGVYLRLFDEQCHTIGRINLPQIKRKHLTLPTWSERLIRKTICFSKSERLHDTVIRLLLIGRNLDGLSRNQIHTSRIPSTAASDYRRSIGVRGTRRTTHCSSSFSSCVESSSRST